MHVIGFVRGPLQVEVTAMSGLRVEPPGSFEVVEIDPELAGDLARRLDADLADLVADAGRRRRPARA